jgi:PPOX class probable F420-dependent enzyme
MLAIRYQCVSVTIIASIDKAHSICWPLQNTASSTASMPTEQPFQCAQYLKLGTFRKSGLRVDTPVWFAARETSLYVFSNRDAGKVKRLKNNAHCMIAPCTFSGTPTGSWREATAHLLTSTDEIHTAHQALKQKYGWQMSLLDFGARLGGRINQRSFIRIFPPAQPH